MRKVVILFLFIFFTGSVFAKGVITDEQFDELSSIIVENLDPKDYSIIDKDILNNYYINDNTILLIGPNCSQIKEYSINRSDSSKSKNFIDHLIICSSYTVVDKDGHKSNNSILGDSNIATIDENCSYTILKNKINKIIQNYKKRVNNNLDTDEKLITENNVPLWALGEWTTRSQNPSYVILNIQKDFVYLSEAGENIKFGTYEYEVYNKKSTLNLKSTISDVNEEFTLTFTDVDTNDALLLVIKRIDNFHIEMSAYGEKVTLYKL